MPIQKEKHHPWQVWKTSRGNFRGQDDMGRQRSFKTHKEAAAWLAGVKGKKQDLHTLQRQGVTPKSEVRKVVGFIRRQFENQSEGQEVDFERAMRKVLEALSRIHVKMVI